MPAGARVEAVAWPRAELLPAALLRAELLRAAPHEAERVAPDAAERAGLPEVGQQEAAPDEAALPGVVRREAPDEAALRGAALRGAASQEAAPGSAAARMSAAP